MGAFLEPTPPMRHYRVEPGTESAYIHANLREFNAWVTRERDEPPRRTIYATPGGFAIPVEDVVHLLAAVHQAIDHRGYSRWWSRADPGTHFPPEQWGADIVGDMARIHGPVDVGGLHDATGPIGTVEIDYAALWALREMLKVLVDRAAEPPATAALDAYSPHGSFASHVKAVAVTLGLDLDVTRPSPVTGPMVADLATTLAPVITGPEVNRDALTLLAAGLQALADIAAQEAERAAGLPAVSRLSDHPAFER